METVLTCLDFGVVHPVRDFLLTDQVIYDLHSNGWLRMFPLQDHEGAAGFVYRGKSQPEGTKEGRWNGDPAGTCVKL